MYEAITFKAITEAWKQFVEWTTRRQAQLDQQRARLEEKELNAVRAFQTAVISTSNYVGRLESGEDKDRAQEQELAKLWGDAAIAFLGVDKKIAPLLFLKSLSWSRPDRWIDEEVVKAGITLTEMEERLTQLLKKGDVSS